MPADDSLLAQDTVEFREEERRHRNRDDFDARHPEHPEHVCDERCPSEGDADG